MADINNQKRQMGRFPKTLDVFHLSMRETALRKHLKRRPIQKNPQTSITYKLDHLDFSPPGEAVAT